MIEWLYGNMFIGTVALLMGFAAEAWLRRYPLSVWNVPLVFALALHVLFLGLAGALGVRLGDIWTDSSVGSGSPLVLVAFLAVMVVAQTAIVWVVSIKPARKVGWLWWIYCALVAAWTLFVATQ